MNYLDVNLENCYGIGKFSHKFDFSANNTHLIYAPNGTMKTSFAKTFKDVSKDDKKKFWPSDRIYQDQKTVCDIKIDGSNIDAKTILVVDAEDSGYDTSDKISSFIASKELKRQYDMIYTDLDSQKTGFIKKLKQVSQSSDCENEFQGTFTNNSDNFYEALEAIIEKVSDKYNEYDFKYNDIFDKKGNVKKFIEKNHALLKQYIDNYESLLSKSKFFRKSDNSFGTEQANSILKSIDDNSFFDAGHKFLIDGGIEIESVGKLKELVESEIEKIVADPVLKKNFDSVDKAIGSNVELRAFKQAISNNNLLIIELENYDEFKRNVWVSYFSKIKSSAVELYEFYKSKKNELEGIVTEAKKEQEAWQNIVSIFNSRFCVPFVVKLKNHEDIILKKQTANLEFVYSDERNEPVIKNKVDLLNVLSRGEQRAYFTLQLLFDIESRKPSSDNIIIFDDISDSFDYKNKYAIIEYLNDLSNLSNFKMIVLTHNFDFYRTLASRLNLKNSVNMAVKNVNRQIILKHGQYLKNVLEFFLNKIEDPKIFLSVIPFTRNIVELIEDKSCADYKTLTSCIHMKDDSANIDIDSILAIYQAKFASCKGKAVSFGKKNVIDLIFETADSIFQDQNLDEIVLENKVVISIAIRLKAEKYMLNKLPNFDTNMVDTNQTRELFKEFVLNFPNCKDEIRILDKVNLMTPENIHLNAFMYEPLIDMSASHLKRLYKEIESLYEKDDRLPNHLSNNSECYN